MVAKYLDGVTPELVAKYDGQVAGYTSNPTLLKVTGAKDIEKFAKQIFLLTSKPVSFEVTADDFDGMIEQAKRIASWGDNCYVKIPVTNTKGEMTLPVIRHLTSEKVKVNVTAIMTVEQINAVARSIYAGTPSIMSIFAGRIADTGRDPVPSFIIASRVKPMGCKTLWASTREVLNVKQAEGVADIITMPASMIDKMALFDKDLTQYSLETVQQFFNDGKGLRL